MTKCTQGFKSVFEYFCKKPSWPLETCVALSLGYSPYEINEIQDRIDFLERYNLLFDHIFEKTVKYTQNPDGLLSIAPTVFLDLWDDLRVPYPPELNLVKEIAQVRKTTYNTPEQQNQIYTENEKPLHKREKDCLLKLLAGLLHMNYGYNPIINGEIKAREIKEDIFDKTGIKISEDTILKHFREASKFLKPSTDEQKNS